MTYCINGKKVTKAVFMHHLIRCCKIEIILNGNKEYYKIVSFNDLKGQYLTELKSGHIVSFPSEKLEFKINGK